MEMRNSRGASLEPTSPSFAAFLAPEFSALKAECFFYFRLLLDDSFTAADSPNHSCSTKGPGNHTGLHCPGNGPGNDSY